MWGPLFFDSGKSNYIDAAIAKAVNPALVEPNIQDGPINPVVAPARIGQSVHKHGRSTRHTTGVIRAVSVDMSVNYDGRRAWFENQIEIDTAGFSRGGDSGSLIVNGTTNEAVGLLFAGDGTGTLANPIDDVLAAFNGGLV